MKPVEDLYDAGQGANEVAQRITYVMAGGAVLAVINPGQGFMGLALTVSVLLAMAWVYAQAGGKTPVYAGSNVVAMPKKNKRPAVWGSPLGVKEKRSMILVFASSDHAEASSVLAILRAEGMGPMLVTRKAAESVNVVEFSVVVPQGEAQAARHLVDGYNRRKI